MTETVYSSALIRQDDATADLGPWVTFAENQAAESRCKGLEEALRELRESGMEHATWRCTEPERYPEGCGCGLDELLERVDALLAEQLETKKKEER